MKNTNLKARWSTKEEAALISLHNTGHSYKKIAYKFNLTTNRRKPFRTLSSIQQKLHRLQLSGQIALKKKKTTKSLATPQQAADAYTHWQTKRQETSTIKTKASKPTVKLDGGTVNLLRVLNEAKPSQIVITVGGVEITAIY
tara:strand:+ start:1810 stop:2235 length:426 start_codon:yes stop_codon:yes gene_type:complete